MDIQEFLKQNLNKDSKLYKDLLEFLSLKSISSKDIKDSQIQQTANWLIKKLQEYGFSNINMLMPKNKTAFVDGIPTITAEYMVDTNLPTIAIYGHYDVQPTGEPDWKTDPFTPTLVNNRLYARGASDTKGRLWASILAIYCYIHHLNKKNQRFNIKLILEGEEEIGSPTVMQLLKEDPTVFKANYFFINDMGQINDSTPTVVYSLRGAVYYHLWLKTGEKQLHSGHYGNLALNASQLMTYVLFKLNDIWRNVIRIPNLRKGVRKVGAGETEALASVSPAWEQIKQDSQTYVLTPYRASKQPISPLALTGVYPSLDVHGIWSGYTQKGIKTIIPNTAEANFSLRLVPNLHPKQVTELLEKYLNKLLKRFKGVEYRLETLVAFDPFFEDPNKPELKLLQQIVSKVYQKPAVMAPLGSSIGLLSTYKKQLPNTTVLIHGLGLTKDNVHAANESISLEQINKGALVLHEVLNKV